MKQENKDLVDTYLESLHGMQEAETDRFFYTRLRSKMEHKKTQQQMNWRPAFAISILLVFLFVNLWMVVQQKDHKEDKNASALQNFARAYDFTVSDYN